MLNPFRKSHDEMVMWLDEYESIKVIHHSEKFGCYSHSDSGVLWEVLVVSHHPAKCGGHRQCDSGDMTLLVNEGQDSTCPCIDWLWRFILKTDGVSQLKTKNFRSRHNNFLKHLKKESWFSQRMPTRTTVES